MAGVNVINVIIQNTQVQPGNESSCLGEGAKIVGWFVLILIGIFVFIAMRA